MRRFVCLAFLSALAVNALVWAEDIHVLHSNPPLVTIYLMPGESETLSRKLQAGYAHSCSTVKEKVVPYVVVEMEQSKESDAFVPGKELISGQFEC